MSDLSQLIEITRNIEKQNTEIIRLLKKIAGESENLQKPNEPFSYTPDFGDFKISSEPVEREIKETVEIENPYRIGDLLENTIEVGEVYFLEDGDVFRLSVENDETLIDNLTGSGEACEFSLQETVANESVKNDISLDDSSVILSTQQCENLPETLRICVEQGTEKIYMPLYASAQLVGAPQKLMDIVKFDFYRTEEELLEKLFK